MDNRHNEPRPDKEFETVEINGYTTAYVERGSGPTVVLVHGTLGDYRYWTPQLDALSRSFRMVAVSLRRAYPERWDGAGGGFSIEQHARDVAAFMEYVGVPVALVGFSRGGVVAIEVARSRPELLSSLVLVEAGMDSLLGDQDGAGTDPVPKLAREVLQHFATGNIDGGLSHFCDFAVGVGSWDKRPEAAKQRMRDNAWTLAAQADEQRPSVTCAEFRRFAMPILLFVGELSTARNKAITEAMRLCLPDAEVVTISGAAHTMSATHPDAFNEALSAFLSLS